MRTSRSIFYYRGTNNCYRIFSRCMKHDANRVSYLNQRTCMCEMAFEKLNFPVTIAFPEIQIVREEGIENRFLKWTMCMDGPRENEREEERREPRIKSCYLRRGTSVLSSSRTWSDCAAGSTRTAGLYFVVGRRRFWDASAAAPRGRIHIEKLAATRWHPALHRILSKDARNAAAFARGTHAVVCRCRA